MNQRKKSIANDSHNLIGMSPLPIHQLKKGGQRLLNKFQSTHLIEDGSTQKVVTLTA